jgi:cell pole-organizing protein PopZ
MTAYPKSNDATLDDIMVSIRRIMGNDDSRATAPNQQQNMHQRNQPQRSPLLAPPSAPIYKGFDNEPLRGANDGGTYPYRGGQSQQVHNQPASTQYQTAHSQLRKGLYDLTEPVYPVEQVDNTRALDPRGRVSDIEFAPNAAYAQAPRAQQQPQMRPQETREYGRAPLSASQIMNQQNYPRHAEQIGQHVQESLLSPQSNASISSAFSQLSQALPQGNGLPNMEETVKEMLAPMLKKWLDDNLPSIVERLIKAEIERVARGGR